MGKFIFIWSFFITFTASSQIHYFSDCFKGGVVGDGYNAWYTGGISQVNLPVPSGSIIKKAFFFSNIYKWQGNNVSASDKIIEINGQPLVLSEQYSLGNVVYMQSIQNYISTIAVDITHLINPLVSNYSINPFINVSPVEAPLYSDFYILVLYENVTFETSCIDIYINDKNTTPSVSYTTNAINPLNTSQQVGLSVHSSHICNVITDGYEVFVNGTNIGLIGGQEDNTDVHCAGVIGSFYYHNEELFGIGNDSGSIMMSGLDAIANIQPYIVNQNITVGFEYMSNSSPYSNLINQLFLTYTTPCDTFSVSIPTDTTVCYDSQVQLNTFGGQNYEWQPTTGLSCSDCPNPVFSADSTMFYTIRIWNNDSCSVVRPLKINVRPQPAFGDITTMPTECGSSMGSISTGSTTLSELFAVSHHGDTISVSGNTITGLSEGDYTVFYTDPNGCESEDTLITIGIVNNTVADFTVTPQSGSAPLSVVVENSSQNASHFIWSVNGEEETNPFYGFTADTSGTYKIMLIAWQHDSLCADTAFVTVLVYDSLMIHIPNVFTPNFDGINDYFSITTNMTLKCDLVIVNRWGNEVFSFSGNLNTGINTLWSASDVTDGIYFYKIVFSSSGNAEGEANLSTDQLKKEGFVTVAR